MSNQKRLLEILMRGEETKEIDYKAPCSWDSKNKNSCCELVKDILAFANTLGGYLIIGVCEIHNGFEYTGLSLDQSASFDTTKINQFVNNYADPPINTTVYKLQHESKIFVIISIPQFSDTPHICQKEFPKVLSESTIYVRTDNNESAPLKKSSDFRLLIENAIKNRTDQLLTSIRSILKHGYEKENLETDEQRFFSHVKEAQKRCDQLDPFLDKNYGYREIIFFPAQYSEKRFNIDQLQKMVINGSVSYTGWPFIYYNRHDIKQSYIIDDGIETCISDPHLFHGGELFHFWRLISSGLIYTKEILVEDSYLRANSNNSLVLDFDRFCQMSALSIDCLTRLYSGNLHDDEEICLSFRLNGLENRSIQSIFGQRMFIRGELKSKINDIEYNATKSLAEWRAGITDHAIDICKYVFTRFNWLEPNLKECRGTIQKMFERKL